MDTENRERRVAETQFAADLRSQFEALGERARQPRRRRRWVVIAVAVGVAVAALLGGVTLAGGFDPDSTQLPDPPLPAKSVYPTNASGQTYGTDRPLVEEPDLVAVVATNGQHGYCLKTDLDGPEQMPKTPEEAEAINEAGLRGRTIPVYESDGTTQVGVFMVGGPGTKTVGKMADGTTITQTADADGNIITTTERPDGTTTITTKALDGTTTTTTSDGKTESSSAEETPSADRETSPEPAPKPRDWLLDRMSRLARDAGDARATARWELQWRYYVAGVEGENAPESEYAQWTMVWVVILHGDFTNWLWPLPEGASPPAYSWIYQLLDRDSHNVLSEGTSARPFDTSRMPPMQGPITLGDK